MKKEFLFILFGIVFLLFIQTASADILSDCETISSSGYYELDRDITSANTCFTIATSNVEIDCKGYMIEYANTGTATRFGIDVVLGVVPLENITIRNCIIRKPSDLNTAGYGIRMQRTSNSQIINNTIQTNGTTNNYGLYLLTSNHNNLIENNTIEAYGNSMGNIGIYLSAEVRDSIVRNNIVSGTGTTTSYALLSSYGRDNLIENNNFLTYSSATTSNGHVVYLGSSSERNTIRNNYIYGQSVTTNYHVYLASNSNGNKIYNNTIIANGTGATNVGVYIVGSNYNLIENNTISTSGTSANYGIYLYQSSEYNIINKNTISTYGTSTNNYGIFSYIVLLNDITENSITTDGTSTGNIGIYAVNSLRMNILNNTISTGGTTTAYGIGFSGSNVNVINDNQISTSCSGGNCYGLYLTGSDLNEFIRNNISTSGTSGNSGVFAKISVSNILQENQISAVGTTTLNTGISFTAGANYNIAFNNTISTYGSSTNHGVYLLSTNGNNVSNNQISTDGTSRTNHGVFITTGSDRNIVAYNNISTYGTTANYGVNIANGNNNTILENYIVANGSTTASGTTTTNYGITLSATSYLNEIHNNTIYNGGGRYNYGIYLRTSSWRNTFIGNNINTGGTGAYNMGFYVVESHNNTIEDNIISTSGSSANYGVYFASSSRFNLLDNNNISTSGGTNSHGIFFQFVTPGYPESNTIKNNSLISVNGNDIYFGTASINETWLINQPINKYQFRTEGTILNIRNESYGEIKFLTPQTGSGSGYSDKVYINENLVFINSGVSALNKSAKITIYNLQTTSTELQILKDGTVCGNCVNLTSMQAGNVTFNVTGGGSYSIEPLSSLPLVELNLPENEFTTNQQNINFNFTSTDDSAGDLNCSIYLNEELNQTNSSTANNTLTNFEVLGLSGGNHSWYIGCFDSAGNRNISETRNFTITIATPSVLFNYPTPDLYIDNTNSVLLNYTAINNDLREMTVWLYGNGNLLNTSENIVNGTELTYNWEELSLGQHNWSIIANDGLSNSTEETYYFNLINLSINCEAGGPYQSGALVLVQGNITDGISALTSQEINASVYKEDILQTSKLLLSLSDGSFQTNFAGLEDGDYTLNLSSSYQEINKICSDNLSIGGAVSTSASFNLDKLISLQELNPANITYNITLKLTNKGGSNATSVNITDSDSDGSPYDIGTLESGQIETRSYLKTFERNSTNYNLTLKIASANGIDSLADGLISANSSEITIIIPATTADTQITLTKNVEFSEENETSVTYNITSTFVNSGGIDLTGISIKDSNLDLNDLINLNRTQSYSVSGEIVINKTISVQTYFFSKANATYDSTTYYSNELSVLIPALATNSSLLLSKSASFYSETFTNITYNISLVLTNIGGRNSTNTFIYDSDSDGSPYDIGTLTAGQIETRSYLKTFEKQSITTNQDLATATTNATDSISEEIIEASSNLVTILIPAKPSSASFVLDKISNFHNLTNETFTYNITLKLTNKGGSNATSVNITDSDSDGSPYDIGTLTAGQIETRSYLKTFERNSTNYNRQTQIAQVQGIDSLSDSPIYYNSTQTNLTIPSTETGEQLTVIKNVYYNNQTSTNVNYTLSIEIINSGGEDLNGIVITDDDLEISDVISLNRTQSDTYSGSLLITKEQSNKEHTFSIARATANLIVYSSQQIKILIPGYGGGPNDVGIEAPTWVYPNTNFDVLMTVKNVNPDIGQDFILNYWLLSEDESLTHSNGGQTLFVAANGATNSTTITFLSPSSAGNYKIRANVTGEGVSVQATALSTILVTSSGPDTGDTGAGGSSGGGGGSITGDAVQEVICSLPYMRYGLECCLNANNNSICDKDEILEIPEEEKSQETPEIEKPSRFNDYISFISEKIKGFFFSTAKGISKNKFYLFIGFGALILILIIFLSIKHLIKRNPKDTTRLKNTIGKEVYAENGDKIGKIKEVYLEDHKIYGWLIKPNKNIIKKIRKKNILVKHKFVKSIGEVMIIEERIAEHLEKLDFTIK